MLTKEQFVNAMKFFDEEDRLRLDITAFAEKFFDGNGLLFTGFDKMCKRYITLLCQAMDLDPDDPYNLIEYWLYEVNNNIYGEPDEAGICKKIGEADHKFFTIKEGDVTYTINNVEELYDYIYHCYA